MLQIAAYLQHICCQWRFLKNYEFSKDETQGIASLESNYTSYQISWCCSNQKCCCNMLQQPEVLQQLVAKLCNVKIWLLVHFYMLYWSGRLPHWFEQRYAANCSIFAAHLLQGQFLKNYKFSQDETQDYLSLESNYTSCQVSWCCSIHKCCINMLQQPEVQQQLAAKLHIWET